jgi:hypothetical protein
MGRKHYVDNGELEDWWMGWLVTGCEYAWGEVGVRIYLICEGIAAHFNPKSVEEGVDHVHDACVVVLDKIRSGKLRFIRGKAPVFNLVTTTVFRILYSKMNKEKKHREHLARYQHEFVVANGLEFVECEHEHDS